MKEKKRGNCKNTTIKRNIFNSNIRKKSLCTCNTLQYEISKIQNCTPNLVLEEHNKSIQSFFMNSKYI